MDVVIIGGGRAGQSAALACINSGLKTALVEISAPKPDDWPGEWVEGKGVVSGSGMVTVLDPDTADERLLIPTKATVVAVGAVDPENLTRRLLGITKLGAELASDGRSIVCNSSGETRAAGIFATGKCASTPTPQLTEALIQYCSKSLAER